MYPLLWMLEQVITGWMHIKMNFGKSLERFVKKVFQIIFRIIIPQKEISPEEINPNDIVKILIVHQDRKIGNFILSTPLIEATNKIFKNSSIDILIANNIKFLADDNPYINSVHIFNHKEFIKNPFNLFKFLSSLKKNRYDLAIESSNPTGTSFLNGWIAYKTRAEYRIGFTGGSGEIFTNIHITPDRSKHYHIMKQELVNSVSKIKYELKPEIFADKNEINELISNLRNQFHINADKEIAGIWIGARNFKKWDIENFKIVYQKIKSETKFFPILLFGIEEEMEYQSINKNDYNSIKIVNLKKLKTMISSCRVFICGDTGPLHFSFALTIPTIGIFLQHNYNTYGYADSSNNFIVKPTKTNKMIDEILKCVNKITL